MNASALALSSEDVDRLLTDTSYSARVDMTHKIGGAYNKTNLSASEAMIAEQIFRLLLRDTELKVRVSLAEYVKDSKQIPRDIVMSLARDVAEVSLPVLQFSEVLSDDDLMDLISSTEDVKRYLAISKRRNVSDSVSHTLIERGSEVVAASLIENDGAIISEGALDRILKEHATSEALMERLSKRPLSVVTVNKMLNVVSKTLASKLKEKYSMPSGQIDQEVEKAQEKETLTLVRHAASETDIEKLIAQLQGFGKLSPSIILSALCQGNFEFFEMSLAKLSSTPVANARKLINDRGDLGFRAIYNKSGLPDAMFPAVKLLLKVVRELSVEGEKPGSPRYANRIVERLLQYSEENPIDNMSYVIALVRRA